MITPSRRTIGIERTGAAPNLPGRSAKPMKNITVTINDNTYRQARVWAAKRDTSVSAAVAALLENLPAISRTLCVSAAKPDATKPAAPSSASI